LEITYLEERGDDMITFNWSLQEYVVRIWFALYWFRKGSDGKIWVLNFDIN
jgi:hypothetical protein